MQSSELDIYSFLLVPQIFDLSSNSTTSGTALQNLAACDQPGQLDHEQACSGDVG
jgi:hypothetical protein